MVEPDGKNLILLFSTPRSGSTLLSTILGNHADIFCPNEPWLLLSLHSLLGDPDTPLTEGDTHWTRLGLREFLSPPEFLPAARAFALAAYNQKLRDSARTHFLDKTPRYYHILPFIDDLFPAAKKIWLQRNPLAVAASFQSTWKVPMESLVAQDSSALSFDLTLSLHNFQSFLGGRTDVFPIRYEDLVVDPAPHLERLCRYLEIPAQAGLENYAGNPEQVDALRQKTMGDKKIFAHSRPHTQSLDRWETELSRAQIQLLLDAIGTRFFSAFGYTDTLDRLRAQNYSFPSDATVDQRMDALAAQSRAVLTNGAPLPEPPAQAADSPGWKGLVEKLRGPRPRND